MKLSDSPGGQLPVLWFWRRFLKVFTIYGCDGHIDHVTWTV